MIILSPLPGREGQGQGGSLANSAPDLFNKSGAAIARFNPHPTSPFQGEELKSKCSLENHDKAFATLQRWRSTRSPRARELVQMSRCLPPQHNSVRRSARMRLMSRAAADDLQSRLGVTDHFVS